MFTEQIKQKVETYFEKAKEIRHQIHMYPETAFEEHKTADLIYNTLTQLGIEAKKGVGKTGVVGLIKGEKPGKTVLLRADMDALEMDEEADVPYKSTRKGFMHACGHDGHTAGLLLAAMILQDMKKELRGNVKLMFQPAEEATGGAKPMIDEGLLENPKVDAGFACHLWGSAPEGTVLMKAGATMASPDAFEFTIVGKGGHAAMPHLSVDPIAIAVQAITVMQNIISRRKDPMEPAVVTFSYIHGGEVHNIIPNEVKVGGTIRTYDKEIRQWIPEAMEDILKGLCTAQGASYRFKVDKRYPPLVNDEAMTAFAESAIAKVVGQENIDYMPTPNMGAEDFSYVCESIPACFFFVGIQKDEPVLHHNPHFQWADENLKISAACLCQIAMDFLLAE